MKRTLTGEQLRFLWRRCGGGALRSPLQVVSPARTRDEAWARTRALEHWWRGREDPALWSAVRLLSGPRLWVEALRFDAAGRPGRGLLGIGATGAVLAVQRPEPAGPGEAGTAGGWSVARGGACEITTGDAAGLIAALTDPLPEFAAAAGAPLRAGLSEAAPRVRADAEEPPALSRRATVTDGERLRALLGAPRLHEGTVAVTRPGDGERGRPAPRLAWIVHDGGGWLFGGDGALPGAALRARHGGPEPVLWSRPAARRDVAAAVGNLVSSFPEGR